MEAGEAEPAVRRAALSEWSGERAGGTLTRVEDAAEGGSALSHGDTLRNAEHEHSRL